MPLSPIFMPGLEGQAASGPWGQGKSLSLSGSTVTLMSLYCFLHSSRKNRMQSLAISFRSCLWRELSISKLLTLGRNFQSLYALCCPPMCPSFSVELSESITQDQQRGQSSSLESYEVNTFSQIREGYLVLKWPLESLH